MYGREAVLPVDDLRLSMIDIDNTRDLMNRIYDISNTLEDVWKEALNNIIKKVPSDILSKIEEVHSMANSQEYSVAK